MKKQTIEQIEQWRPEKGTWWTYWDKKARSYIGPDINGSTLAYQSWSRKMKDGKKILGVIG